MIHEWAQPSFYKEQLFLILAKTMRTWVKELAPLWGPYIKAALCTVKSRLFQEMQEVVVAAWCWAEQSRAEHNNQVGMLPPHKAAEDEQQISVWQRLSSYLPLFGHSFFPHSGFTSVTCVRRAERCGQTGQCSCVHVYMGNTTDTSARASGRRRPGQNSDAQPQISQAIRFNSGWLTLLLWLQQLEWQTCSLLSFFCGPTLPAVR